MKKIINKLLSLFLAVTMCFTVTPVFAASIGSISSDISVGEDTAQNAQTRYSEVGEGTANTDVYLTIDDNNIVVGVPTEIIVSGTPNENGVNVGEYSVSAIGDIAGNKELTITPNSSTVTLTQTGKNDVTATITQEKTVFTSDELANGTSSNGRITANLTAGSWKGDTTFNVELNQIEWYDITSTIDILNNGDVGKWNKYGAYTASTTYSTINIPVRAGEIFRISGMVHGSDRLALVRTDLARDISTYNLDGVPALDVDGPGRVTDEIITIPEGGKWLCLSIANMYINYFKVEKYGNNIVDISKNYTDETMSWNFDKVYMTITVDDTNINIDEITELSNRYSVPFNYATIPSRLNEFANNGETKKDILLQAQANGSEILVHDISWLVASSSYEEYYNYFITNKNTLEENGFVVNGVIQSGGANFQYQDFALATKLAYQGGYLYGDAISSNNIYNKRFYNPRIFNDNLTLEQWKAEIDKVVEKGSGWVNIGTHCYGNVSMDIEQLEAIINYAQEKGITITTWNTLYNACAINK